MNRKTATTGGSDSHDDGGLEESAVDRDLSDEKENGGDAAKESAADSVHQTTVHGDEPGAPSTSGVKEERVPVEHPRLADANLPRPVPQAVTAASFYKTAAKPAESS